MNKKKLETKPMQAGFRLEPDEEAAFARYTKSERFPPYLTDAWKRRMKSQTFKISYSSPSSPSGNACSSHNQSVPRVWQQPHEA